MLHLNKTVITLLTGCCLLACSRNTGVSRQSVALRTSLQAQNNTLRQLDRMGEQSNRAAAEGRVAASTNADIQNYVVSERATVEGSRQALQKALTDVNAYNTGRATKSEQEVVDMANAAIQKSTETLRILDKKTEVIVDFLGNETFSKSEIRTLFPSGDYTLDASQIQEGQQRFRPIVEKLFTFADKYKTDKSKVGFRQLRGEIIITGYSDAVRVEQGGPLYQSLIQRLQKDNNVSAPTSSDLNKKLSELRAETIKGLLEAVIQARKQTDDKPMDIKITVSGRGEELPKGLPASTPIDDPARRVATFYWVVLPVL